MKAEHCLFGLRVVHGDVVFFAISSNHRHSALILHLSRARGNDGALDAKNAASIWRRQLKGHDVQRFCLGYDGKHQGARVAFL